MDVRQSELVPGRPYHSAAFVAVAMALALAVAEQRAMPLSMAVWQQSSSHSDSQIDSQLFQSPF
jgi:hypothetical protein